MIGLQAPLWLLLLALIPVLHWLHRFRLQPRILPSTTLFLWARLQRDSAQDGDLATADPRWILRALICSLLILALAEPQLRGQEGPLEVWVDDSLSMFTREPEQSRLQGGLQQLQSYLGAHDFAQIRLHSLGNPAHSLTLDPQHRSRWQAQLDAWAGQHRAEPSPPASLSSQNNHLLITDGADSALNRWAQSAPLTQIISTGKLRQNLALSRLNIRSPVEDTTPDTGTLRIDNLGDSAASARLVIRQQQKPIRTIELEIPPQGHRITTFSLEPGNAGTLEAELQSKDDALPLDDRLELDLALSQSVTGYILHGSCAPGIMAVINSHPALVETSGQADLLIDCSSQPMDSTLPALWLHPAEATLRTTQTAHWHKPLPPGYLPLAAGLAYSDAAPPLASSRAPLLSANGRTLIGQQAGARRVIDSYLDAGDARLAGQAQYPLIYLGLISYLSGKSLESPPLTIGRDIEASRIQPMHLAPGATSRAPLRAAAMDFTHLILFTVFLLLVLDAALGLRAATGRLDWQT